MGLGRMVGEFLNETYPNGLAYFSQDLATNIIPATYAITGSSRFTSGLLFARILTVYLIVQAPQHLGQGLLTRYRQRLSFLR